MRVQHLVAFLALLLVHPASSSFAVLHRTEQTLAQREASGMISGEDEGSAVDSENNPNISITTPENAKLNSVKVGHRNIQVTRLENERGVRRFLNPRPVQGETSGVDLPEKAPKTLSLPRLSNMQENVVKPATNIEVDPVLKKPFGKAIAGSTNITTTVKQLDPFEQDCLETHNSYRAKHGVPPLMWSAELAESAQAWADQLASNDLMQHDHVAMTDGKMGENLAYFTPPIPKCERAVINNCVMCREMVQRWYDEIKNYDFDKGQSRSHIKTPYKHFSQIIWANTAEVGVGTAVSNKFGFITVARYRPMGNDGGAEEFIKNVPPDGGPLPTVVPPSEPARIEHPSTVAITSETVVKDGTAPAATPDTAQTRVPSPAGTLTDIGNKDFKTGGSEKAASEKGLEHTVTAADGSQARVYLSKSGDHAGIVFRDQISRAAYPSVEPDVISRTIQVL